MPIPVQLYNSLVPVQLCRTTTTTRVLYRSTTTVPVRILLGKLYSVQPYSRTRTLTLRRSQKVTKTTVFVCWNIFFKKSSWDRFAARTGLERSTCRDPCRGNRTAVRVFEYSTCCTVLPCFGQNSIIGSGTADSVLVSRRSHKTKLLLTSPRSRPYKILRVCIGHTLRNLLSLLLLLQSWLPDWDSSG